MADLRTRIPDFNLPIFNPQTGMMNPVWFQFFLKLFDRTGGTGGEPPGFEAIISTQSLLNSAVQIQADTAGFQDIVAQLQSVPLLPRAPQFYLGDVAAHGIQADELLHALVTTATNGFMSAADKVKLDSLINGLSASLTASVTTTNTTADADILSLVVPAATFVTGSVLQARLMADISGAAAGGNLNIWIKVGATKLHTLTVSLPAGATSGIGLRLNMLMTQRSGTTMQLSGELVTAQDTLLPAEVITTILNTFDASISNTVILGWNWSAANAANIAIAHTCLIKQEK